MTIFDVLSLIGGLALFLFGMNVMGQALETAAGNRLKSILSKLTNSPVRGLLLGLGVTAVIQSSSATTVMVVGFVNSGIMELRQAIGVIMGANIGTTVTAWLISLTGIEGDGLFMQLLKPSSFTPILALIGIALYMLSKSDKKHHIGTVLLGFAVLMYGMETMSDAVKPLREIPEFAQILTLFSNPILGVLAGAILTGIIQSSSASVGILQALSATGAVTYGAAIPIIMGQNIGTTVTALISSVGTSRNARRAALVHLYFNVIGTVVGLILFYVANAIFKFSFVSQSIDQAGIAVVHSLFNVACTCILMPFNKQLEYLATKTVRDLPSDVTAGLLDPRLLSAPSIAVERCRKVACDMANIVRDNLLLSITLLDKYSEEGVNAVIEAEDVVDNYEDQLGTFLVQLSAKKLSGRDNDMAAKLLHAITDLERISDHSVNIAESARELHDKDISFSDAAKQEMKVMSAALIEIINLSLMSFMDGDTKTAVLVEPLEEVIDDLTVKMKDAHIKRLQNGDCTINIGFVFNDILTNFERVSDHCSNLAIYEIELARSALDTHAYINKLGTNVEFMDSYRMYSEKYSLDNI